MTQRHFACISVGARVCRSGTLQVGWIGRWNGVHGFLPCQSGLHLRRRSSHGFQMGTVRFRRKLLAGNFPMGQGVQGFRPEAFSLREILPETKFISWTLTKNLNRVGSKEKRAWGLCRLVMRRFGFGHGAFCRLTGRGSVPAARFAAVRATRTLPLP